MKFPKHDTITVNSKVANINHWYSGILGRCTVSDDGQGKICKARFALPINIFN